MSEQATESTHTVTLRFTGPESEKMADHFFASWVDGDISQIWAEALDDADIAEAIAYDGDAETRTLTIEVSEADDDDETEEDKEEEVSEESQAEDSNAEAA